VLEGRYERFLYIFLVFRVILLTVEAARKQDTEVSNGISGGGRKRRLEKFN